MVLKLEEVSDEHNSFDNTDSTTSVNTKADNHADAEVTAINITDTVASVSTKPETAAGVSTGSDPVLSVHTEAVTDTEKQQQKGQPQSACRNTPRPRNTAEVKDNIAELEMGGGWVEDMNKVMKLSKHPHNG